MQTEKKSFRSKISLGLIILTPLTLVLYIGITILRIFSEISYEVLWKYLYPNIFWLVAAFSGLFVYLIVAWLLGSIYHSNKTRLSEIVDNLMLNIPLVKHIWHAGRFRYENRTLDFSKVRAAIIDLHEGVWDIVFITGIQKFQSLAEVLILSREMDKESGKNHIIMARAIDPTVPIPVTGFFRFIDEERLRRKGRIIYLKNPATELFKIYLSVGFISPDKLEAEN